MFINVQLQRCKRTFNRNNKTIDVLLKLYVMPVYNVPNVADVNGFQVI